MSSTNLAVTPESLLRQAVLDLQAYPVSDSTGMVKLDAMENPYPLPQSLREEIARLVADAAINRYPDADAQRLKASIRAVTGLPQSLDVLLGNGSDEIIQLLALAVAKPGATLLSVEPSFVRPWCTRGASSLRTGSGWGGWEGVGGLPCQYTFCQHFPALGKSKGGRRCRGSCNSARSSIASTRDCVRSKSPIVAGYSC